MNGSAGGGDLLRRVRRVPVLSHEFHGRSAIGNLEAVEGGAQPDIRQPGMRAGEMGSR